MPRRSHSPRGELDDRLRAAAAGRLPRRERRLDPDDDLVAVEEDDVDREAHEERVHRAGRPEQDPLVRRQLARPRRPRIRRSGRAATSRCSQTTRPSARVRLADLVANVDVVSVVASGNDGPPSPSSEITCCGWSSAGRRSTERTAASVRPPGCWCPAIGVPPTAAMSTACPYDVRRDDAGPRERAVPGEEARDA